MCGIAGVHNFDGSPVLQDLPRRMIGMLRHRGPDADGYYTDGPTGLGHSRLSIIDLSGGQQPMCNEDGTLWITFNGEIFNYLELRQDLIARGHQFATRSDTEVILHLFEEKGEDCVRYLNGQWAFAIWNAKSRSMFLSRDRLGVRPLFYTVAGQSFVFGSEIKALFAHPAVKREIDPQGLNDVFTFWSTLAPRTTFKDIHELPPGHSMWVRNGQTRVSRYWDLEFHPEHAGQNNGNRSEADYAEELLSLLVDATRIRLRSDVPVGAYLSGGLDSTITTALIRKFTDTPLRTFSVAFTNHEFDERSYQQEAVRHLNTDHQQICCSEDDIGRVFPQVVWHMEKPVLRTAPAPLFLLAQLVRQSGYKVVLTGEGSDEMFGGYDIYKETKIRRFWMAHPNSRLRPLLLRKLYPYLPNLQAQPDAYLKAFFGIHPEGETGPFFSHMPRWELTGKTRSIFSAGMKEQIRRYTPYADLEDQLPTSYGKWSWLTQAQYLEATLLLPGYILSSQGDRVAMAHSVEGRYPFLDYRVVNFASQLPARLKLKVLNEKYLLKRAAGEFIPDSIRKRPKQPYRAPEASCFFTPAASAWVHELLSTRSIQRHGLFDPQAVERLIKKFRGGQAIGIKDNMAMVGLVSTQMMADQFLNDFTRSKCAND
jgi:asparagine synthase (glutamine-hydrolysing)